MTVGVAWVRTTRSGDELWFASDSRLTGDGKVWSACPKLFLLPGRDAVAAFCGSTAQAYPLVLQMQSAIIGYPPAESGQLEFSRLVGHLERVVNDLLTRVEADPLVPSMDEHAVFESRGDSIVIGGYSSQARGFIPRRLTFEAGVDRWVFSRAEGQPNTVGPNKPFAVFGDRAAAPKVHHLVLEQLKRAEKYGNSQPFDLEPFDALWEYLALPDSSDVPVPEGFRSWTVGGSPQAIVTRSGGRSAPVVVRWSGADYVFGRPVLPGENLSLPLIERGQPGRFVMSAPNTWGPAEHPPEN